MNKSTKGFIVAETSCLGVAVALNNCPLISIPIMAGILLAFSLWLIIKNPDKIGVKKE